MRSIATRRQHLATSEMLSDHIAYLKSQGFDLVIVETAGIGQSDSARSSTWSTTPSMS